MVRSTLLLCAVLGACAEGKSDSGGGGGGGADAGRLIDAGPQPDAGPDIDSGQAGGTPVTLTQSTSMAITADNSVACIDDLEGFNIVSSYFRMFDLASEGITTPLAVSKVSFGVESASGAGGDQPAQVKIHALTGTLTNDNLDTPVDTADFTIDDDQSGMLVEVAVNGTIQVGSKLVVELAIPDGSEGNSLFVGSNAAGQSGPTYVRDDCGGAEEPTSLADLGEPNMHWVLSVDGTK